MVFSDSHIEDTLASLDVIAQEYYSFRTLGLSASNIKYFDLHNNLWSKTIMPFMESHIVYGLVDDILFEFKQIMNLAIENCYTRAYNPAQKGKKIDLNFMFGLKGYLAQVIDFGTGFDAVEFVKKTMSDERVNDVHFQEYGCGLDSFHEARKHNVKIDSSSKGTTVSMWHFYYI